MTKNNKQQSFYTISLVYVLAWTIAKYLVNTTEQNSRLRVKVYSKDNFLDHYFFFFFFFLAKTD